MVGRNSLKMSEAKYRIATWDYMHKEKNHGALSGCQYEETLETLKLTNLVTPDSRILEIGVGFGYVTKALYNHVNKVDAFDISSIALENVRDYCYKSFTLSDIEDMSTNCYDVIFCQNVIQHIPTPMLYYEMFHFIRSLESDGVMAVKSISTDGYKDTGDDPEIVIEETRCHDSIGCFCRSESYLKKIIDRCGGVATLVASKPCDVMFINAEQIFHITKKKYD